MDAEVASSLARALDAERRRGGDERALRELIANRLRLRKAAALAVYQRFDSAWHAGVNAGLHGGDAPGLEVDAFAHHAFEAGRGRVARAIAAHGETAGAPDAGAVPADAMSDKQIAYYTSLGTRHFVMRGAAYAVAVAALTWWLSDASGAKLYAVVGAAIWITFGLSIVAETLIAYLYLSAMIVVIALLAAWAGHGEFLWPCVGACVVGTIEGGAQHYAYEQQTRAWHELQSRGIDRKKGGLA
jgi:hypothetical protein